MSINHDKIRLSHTVVMMFSGHAGVGKSFCSDLAQKYCNELGLKTVKEPLAKDVKATAEFMGWRGVKDAAGRKLLQNIGSAGREYDKNLWVQSVFYRIDESVGYPYDVVFIDDFRFMNEFEYVRDNMLLYKPVPIRVIAPDREMLVGTPEYNDPSETELDNQDFQVYILNRKDDLYVHKHVHRVVDRILKTFNTV